MGATCCIWRFCVRAILPRSLHLLAMTDSKISSASNSQPQRATAMFEPKGIT